MNKKTIKKQLRESSIKILPNLTFGNKKIMDYVVGIPSIHTGVIEDSRGDKALEDLITSHCFQFIAGTADEFDKTKRVYFDWSIKPVEHKDFDYGLVMVMTGEHNGEFYGDGKIYLRENDSTGKSIH